MTQNSGKRDDRHGAGSPRPKRVPGALTSEYEVQKSRSHHLSHGAYAPARCSEVYYIPKLSDILNDLE
jgi:hypothetical protein